MTQVQQEISKSTTKYRIVGTLNAVLTAGCLIATDYDERGYDTTVDSMKRIGPWEWEMTITRLNSCD